MILRFGLSEFGRALHCLGSLVGFVFWFGTVPGAVKFEEHHFAQLWPILRFICFSVLMIVHWLFFWVVLAVQEGLFSPEHGHFMDDILWFLRASGFTVLIFLCCYVLVHVIVLWQVLCLFLCSGGPSILVLWFTESFFFQCFSIISGILQIFLVFCFLLPVVWSCFLACLFYCGYWSYYGFTIGFLERSSILAVRLRLLFSLLSQC